MQIKRFMIKDMGRFHFGDANGDIDKIFSSHQLFSAIINALNLLYGAEKTEEMINHFDEKLAISSLFLGLNIHDNKTSVEKNVYLFPLPKAPIRVNSSLEDQQSEEIAKRKKKKKIKYVSADILKNILNNWVSEAYAESIKKDKDDKVVKSNYFEYDLLKSLLFIGSDIGISTSDISEFGVSEEELKVLKFMTTESKPHNVINRISGASEQIFYNNSFVLKKKEIGNITYTPFMFFLLDGEIPKELNAAINLMADEGIGGRRSKGMGTFQSVETEENVDLFAGIQQNERWKFFYSLGTLLPKESEVTSNNNKLVAYSLKKVDGYAFSGRGLSIRKRACRLLQEGSISSQKINGKRIDVKPIELELDHKIYLYGKGLQIGFGGKI